MTRIPGLAVVLVLVAGGCTQSRLEDEWQITLEQLADLPLEIVDSFPADESVGAGHQIQPYFFFTRPLTDADRAATQAGLVVDLSTDRQIPADVDMDSDNMGLFLRPDDLHRDRSYTLSFGPPLESRAEPSEVGFATGQPQGWAFNMSGSLHVERFGGNAAQAQSLNDQFEPGVYPLWILQILGLPDPTAPCPHQLDFIFAPARMDDQPPPYLLRKEYGYVGRLLGVVVAADGSFDHAQDGVFLPLWSAGSVTLIYLEDVRLTGRLDLTGAEPAFGPTRLTGVVGTRWLLRMAEEGGAWRAAVRVLEPDVDTNGNDKPDSATFTIAVEPTPLELDQLDL